MQDVQNVEKFFFECAKDVAMLYRTEITLHVFVGQRQLPHNKINIKYLT